MATMTGKRFMDHPKQRGKRRSLLDFPSARHGKGARRRLFGQPRLAYFEVLLAAGVSLDEASFFLWCIIFLWPAAVELWAIESLDMLEPLFIESFDIAPLDMEPAVLLLVGVDCCAMAMPVAVRPQSISERQILLRMVVYPRW
jgi:hypothetical protein